MITRVTIQEILADQWETMSEQTLIKRRFSWADELNYCLTGIRRAGKSYMLMQRIRDLLDKGIPRDAILYVSFEDERLLEIRYRLKRHRSTGFPMYFLMSCRT